MPAPLLALLTLAAALVAARSPGRLGFTILLGSVVLVPGSLALPTGVTGLLTVHRVVLIGLVVGLLLQRSGRDRWRPTPTMLAFLLYLLIVVVCGVLLAAPGLQVGDQIGRFLDIAEQAVILLVCTAIVRSDPEPTWFLRPLAGVLAVSAGIGVLEHVTTGSWSHWLFSKLPSQQGSPAAAELARRGGSVRVRAGNDYPLGFSWVTAAMLPALVVVALGLRRAQALVLIGGSALAVAAIYWSSSRSALLGVIVALVVVAVVARDLRVTAVVCAAAALGVAAFVAGPAFSHHFSSAVDQGSIQVRQQRLPLVLGAVANRPWTGLGLGGLKLLGLPATDASYLLSYGETGAGGLAGLVGLLLIAVIGVGRGTLAAARELRVAAAALLAGVLALIAAGLAFDAFALVGTADVLWILVGIGIAVGERARGPVPMFAVPDLFPPVAAAAAVVGVVLVLVAPKHYAQEVQFSTLPAVRDAADYNPVVTGNQLVATTCAAVEAQTRQLRGVETSCRNLYAGPGVGTFRVQTSSAVAASTAVDSLAHAARVAGVTALRVYPDTVIEQGRLTAATTAPLWLSVMVVMLMFAGSGPLVSIRSTRRLRSLQPAP